MGGDWGGWLGENARQVTGGTGMRAGGRVSELNVGLVGRPVGFVRVPGHPDQRDTEPPAQVLSG